MRLRISGSAPAVASRSWRSAALPSLTSLATNYSREYVRDRFAPFGLLSRARQLSSVRVPDAPRPSVDVDVQERLLDRLDPARQLERLSRFLWRRRRLAALRGQWMYFYTGLKNGRGLIGVNINTGEAERAIRVNDPDERFISDEAANLLYVSQGERVLAYALDERE